MQRSTIFWWVVVIILAVIGLSWMSGPSSVSTVAPVAAPSVEVNKSPVLILKTSTDANLGDFLIADNNMTLYYFTKDKPGISNCSGQCAANWPPYIVSSKTPLLAGEGVKGAMSIITRVDGHTQLAYNGSPLYFWYKDTKVGDVNGQNVGGTWFVMKP